MNTLCVIPIGLQTALMGGVTIFQHTEAQGLKWLTQYPAACPPAEPGPKAAENHTQGSLSQTAFLDLMATGQARLGYGNVSKLNAKRAH